MHKQLLRGLSGTELKLLALVIMTIDHIGMILFPSVRILRIAGRMSFPIFAYMIAEGCRYTKNKHRYLAQLFCTGAVCQLVYYAADGSLYMCIFITFSLSAAVIFAVQNAGHGIKNAALCAAAIAAAAAVTLLLPELIHGFDVDYGFWGVMLPVLIYLGRDRRERLILCAAGIIAVSCDLGGIQWWSLTALLPLSLYNGSRGKFPMKYFFYVYYPVHLAVLYLIAELLI